MKDIKNLRARLSEKRGPNDDETKLLQVLEDVNEDGDKVIIILDSDDSTVEFVVFSTKEMISLLEEFLEVIFVDGTYKVNRYNFPLYIL